MKEIRNVQNLLAKKPDGKRQPEISEHRLDHVEMVLKKKCEDNNWIHVAQDTDQGWTW